jgi:hypothetical protein
MTTLNEIIQDQTDLRMRFIRLIKKDPQPIQKYATEIGISQITLNNFLMRGIDVDYQRYFLIENYVEAKEAEESSKKAAKKA